MGMESGARLGPYSIVAELGKGGMGEVYRARDSKLDREVALKILPEDFASDPERLARFRREARLLASLNHPNIAAIYGLEESGPSPGQATPALVLELVEGPTLEDRLRHGAMPLDEALAIARQIAEALEAAHEQGVIHRDLKPANIKVTPDGVVKVLDFGLARALSPAEAGQSGGSGGSGGTGEFDAADAPTMTMSAAATKMGVIMGTAAYMSPEQARGAAVDRRADIWAYGTVLFEMLAGAAPFTEATISDTLAHVLTKDPDWSALPSTTPVAVRRLLRRCLAKDPKRRLSAIGDARLEIDEVTTPPDQPDLREPPVRRASGATVVALAAVAVLVGGGLTWLVARPPVERTVTRLSAVAPPGRSLSWRALDNVAITDAGDALAFTTGDGEDVRLHVRSLGEVEATTLELGERATRPFFSPDGQWIGFFAEGRLMKVSRAGGTPIALAPTSSDGFSGDWGPDDTIVFALGYNRGLARVSAAGGEAEHLTTPDADAGELGHWFPQLLPDGDSVIFTVYAGLTGNRTDILSLSTGERRMLLDGATYVRYVSTGHLIYPTASRTLMAVPFDASTLQVTGSPAAVLEDVVYALDGNSQFSVSATGTLAYVRASTISDDRQLLLVERDGVSRPIVAERQGYAAPEFSPDGSRLAVAIETVASDIWSVDVERGTLSRVTFSPGIDGSPLWTADGERLLFSSEQGGPAFDLFWTVPDGSRDAEEILVTPFDKSAHSVSADGTRLVFTVLHPESGEDIWTLPLQGDGEAQPFVATDFDERMPVLSRDGRWIAYASNESGRFEIYVQAYPGGGRKAQVSLEGGTMPRWAHDGREIFYRRGGRLIAVEVDASGGDVTIGETTMLFEGDYALFDRFQADYDVSPDGQRFVMLGRDPFEAEQRIEVVLNWTEELRARVPTGQ